MYFERQHMYSTKCVLHALNNAMQAQRVTVDEFDQLVHELSQEMGGANKKICDYYSHKLAKNGHKGMWSITVAEEWLIRNHIKHVWNMPHYDLSNGHFFIQAIIGHDSHAIAIVDGMLLDSLNKSPVPYKNSIHLYTLHNVSKIII